jgi:large conductance mechanosensitive channel
MFEEFKKFIARGNVMDMAVGIILGAAFTTIVKSMVDDVFMPIAGVFTGEIDFSNKFINLGSGQFDTLKAAQQAGAPTVNYGLFLNASLNFLIVAFIVFLIVKAVNRMKDVIDREEKEAAHVKKEEPSAPPADIQLLTEIRDLLKENHPGHKE